MKKQAIFTLVAEVSQQLDVDVYVVGGYVRDNILGPELPNQDFLEENRVQAALEKDLINGGEEVVIETVQKKTDIDFVIVGSGIEFAAAFHQYLKEEGSLVEFPDFDTARYVSDDIELEFAGARREAYDPTSRKPMVTTTTLEEDLARRDFTVNAMAQQVKKGGQLGDVIDLFGGLKDVKEKCLKTPLDPDETFSEDPLRMLRAIRFAAQLNFHIEENTLLSIQKNAQRLQIVSKERVCEEFFKLLGTPNPSVGLWLLVGTKLIHEFLPEVPALEGVTEVYGQTHKENLAHTIQVVENIATRTHKPLLRYAALMHDIGKPGTKQFVKGRGWTFDMHEHLGRKIVREVGKRLRMSKQDTEYVANLVRWHQQPIQLMDDGVTDSAVRRLVVNLGDDIDDLLKLCRSDITTGNPNRLKKRLKNYDILEQTIIRVIEKDKLRAFQSPVRGEDIMQLCQLKAGPTVGKIKKAIEEAILDGVIPNEYEPALEYFHSIKEDFISSAEEWEKEK